MEKVCRSIYSFHTDWKTKTKQTHHWNRWPPYCNYSYYSDYVWLYIAWMFCWEDIPRPDKTTSLWSSVDPPLPVAACVQREILLSVLTHLYILCPEGSDEVTKSSVRMQEIHFQSKQMCSRKVLFQSHAVLFLSKHIAHIQGEKESFLCCSHLSLSSLVHHLYVDFSKHSESFSALISANMLFISLSTCMNSLCMDVSRRWRRSVWNACACLFMQACVFLFAGHMCWGGRVCVCMLCVDNDLMQTLRSLRRSLLASPSSRLQWQPNQSSADPLYC